MIQIIERRDGRDLCERVAGGWVERVDRECGGGEDVADPGLPVPDRCAAR